MGQCLLQLPPHPRLLSPQRLCLCGFVFIYRLVHSLIISLSKLPVIVLIRTVVYCSHYFEAAFINKYAKTTNTHVVQSFR